MAKRKRNNVHSNVVKKQATTVGIPSPPHDTLLPGTSINSIISPEELEIAVETLQSLAEHPSIIKSKACKDLRTAVYSFKQASTTGMIAAGEYKYSLRWGGER
jgi:hypothetical protein